MVRVDSLNQLQLQSKDSIIAAQDSVIRALERVRLAAREVVKHVGGSRFACTGGISAGYDPFAKVGFTGLGVTCGVRL